MINKLSRNGAEDTGENDVRGLRELFAEKEAAEHQPLDVSDEEIEQVLLEMAERGELVFGWIEDRGEFGFWLPAEGPAPTPAPPPQAVSHPRKLPRTLYRALAGVATSLSVLSGLALLQLVEHHRNQAHTHLVQVPYSTTDQVRDAAHIQAVHLRNG